MKAEVYQNTFQWEGAFWAFDQLLLLQIQKEKENTVSLYLQSNLLYLETFYTY